MASRMFITGEWGSVAMRLTLCRADGNTLTFLDTVEGGGVVGCTDFEAAFFAAAGPWLDAYGALPVILAGMIGSNIGWRDSGYVACPAGVDDITAHLTTMHRRGIDIHFSPGLKCRNLFGLPDIIRGEEMQVLGWLRQNAVSGRRLICLPGRHVKWLLAEGERVLSFFTGMNGELEDLLLGHSLLGKGVVRHSRKPDAFAAGLDIIASEPGLSLGHALFATRARLVLNEHAPDEASSFLSGLLIGADVRDSLAAHRAKGTDGPVTVLGHGATRDLYLQAFHRFGHPLNDSIPPSDGAIGLAAVFSAIAEAL